MARPRQIDVSTISHDIGAIASLTSPHSSAPAIPVPTLGPSFLKLLILRGLLKWSTTFSLYAMSSCHPYAFMLS
jgi:hypothetical protein